MKLYTILDKKAGQVAAPFAAPNDGIASRYVMESLRDREAMMSKYPADFSLLYVGEYSDKDGALTATPVRLVIDVSVLSETMKG